MKRIEEILANKKNKIIFLVSLSILLALFATLNYNIALYAQNVQNLSIPFEKGTEINEIKINNNVYTLKDFENDYIGYDEISNSLFSKKSTYIVIKVSDIDDIGVLYNKVTSDNDRSIQIGNEIFRFDGNVFCKKVSFISLIKNSYNKFSIILILLYTLVFYICFYTIRKVLNRVNNNKEKTYDIFLIIISEFIICFFTVYTFMSIYKYLAFIPFIIILMLVLIKFKFCINSWEKIYIGIGTVVGIMVLLLVPPGHVPDENSHFTRSFVDANYTFKKKDEIKLPETVNSLFYKFTHDVHSNNQKFSGKTYLFDMLNNPEYCTLSNENAYYENTRYLSFLPYLPSEIIMFMCKFLKVSILTTFLLSRLMNLCICMVLSYFAVKIIPRYKKIIVLIAMFPIFFQQAMGLNMDYLTNSVSLLLIALVFKYKELNVKLTLKQLVLILILAIALGLCKFGYFPLLCLIILIPNDKFKNKKVAIMFKLIFIILPLITSFLFNMTAVSETNYGSEYYTLEKIIKNPLNSIKIFLKTLIYRFDLDIFRGHIDGFGWSTKHHVAPVLWTIASIYIIMIFTKDGSLKQLSKQNRIFVLVITVIVFCLIYLICFVGWTRQNTDMINGVQSRYFIPCMPLLYIGISNDFIMLNVKNKYKFYTILISIVQLLFVFTLIKSFY